MNISRKVEPFVSSDNVLVHGNTSFLPWPLIGVGTEPDESVVRELLIANPGDRLWEYASAIPEEVRTLVKLMPAYHWRLVEMAAVNRDATLKLILGCPALATLIAVGSHNESNRREIYARKLSVSWLDLLSLQKLPSRRRTLRIMQKVPLGHSQPDVVQSLARHLRNEHPYVRVLAHLPVVTRDTVALLRLSRTIVSPKLLQAAMASEAHEEPITWLVESVMWLRELENTMTPWPYGTLDADALKSVERKLRDRNREPNPDDSFPPPPFSAIPGQIEPIPDYCGLTAEADEQRNCSLDYATEIAAGHYYFYSIHGPDRATLALRRRTRGWIIEDLKAIGNADVSAETTRLVESWLLESQGATHSAVEGTS